MSVFFGGWLGTTSLAIKQLAPFVCLVPIMIPISQWLPLSICESGLEDHFYDQDLRDHRSTYDVVQKYKQSCLQGHDRSQSPVEIRKGLTIFTSGILFWFKYCVCPKVHCFHQDDVSDETDDIVTSSRSRRKMGPRKPVSSCSAQQAQVNIHAGIYEN